MDGLGAAQLIGVLNHPTNPDTIRIEGRGIIIKGFNISGGRDGIHVHFGGTSRQFNTAGIEGNTIQNTGRNGIVIHANSTATIINNIITNNMTGILVGENAVARIGKIYHGTGNPGTPNTIESNSHEGIVVLRSSNANIVGNFIRNNGLQGILVKGSSNAEVYDNQISGNLSQGIRVVGSSAVEISSNNVIENNGENGVYVVSGGLILLDQVKTIAASSLVVLPMPTFLLTILVVMLKTACWLHLHLMRE